MNDLGLICFITGLPVLYPFFLREIFRRERNREIIQRRIKDSLSGYVGEPIHFPERGFDIKLRNHGVPFALATSSAKEA